MRNWLIKKLKGYTRAEIEQHNDWFISILEDREKARLTDEDINDYVKTVKGKKKTHLLNEAVSELFKGVTLEDLEDRFNKLDKTKQEHLKGQAKAMKDSYLTIWLHEEMLRVAQKKLYLESQTPEDMIFGKACLWMEDVRMKKIIKLSLMK